MRAPSRPADRPYHEKWTVRFFVVKRFQYPYSQPLFKNIIFYVVGDVSLSYGAGTTISFWKNSVRHKFLFIDLSYIFHLALRKNHQTIGCWSTIVVGHWSPGTQYNCVIGTAVPVRPVSATEAANKLPLIQRDMSGQC